MDKLRREGISFGITSGTITTLGLMVGLYSGTRSTLAVIGGILIIAVADSLSDSLSLHSSEEAGKDSAKKIKTTPFYTFLSKFIYTLTFALPLILFSLNIAIIVNIIYGLLMLSLMNFCISDKRRRFKVAGEHFAFAIAVIILTYFLGGIISRVFG
jgi:hypothetical protein